MTDKNFETRSLVGMDRNSFEASMPETMSVESDNNEIDIYTTPDDL